MVGVLGKEFFDLPAIIQLRLQHPCQPSSVWAKLNSATI